MIDQGVADTVNTVLSGVVENGTARAAALSSPAAGKTGTTNDNKDAWFTGYTCHLTTSVWMGYRNPQEMKTYKGQKVQGGTIPGRDVARLHGRGHRGRRAVRVPTDRRREQDPQSRALAELREVVDDHHEAAVDVHEAAVDRQGVAAVDDVGSRHDGGTADDHRGADPDDGRSHAPGGNPATPWPTPWADPGSRRLRPGGPDPGTVGSCGQAWRSIRNSSMPGAVPIDVMSNSRCSVSIGTSDP